QRTINRARPVGFAATGAICVREISCGATIGVSARTSELFADGVGKSATISWAESAPLFLSAIQATMSDSTTSKITAS
ncbi:MAG TPA: hypothetical protein VM509_14370, partial [Planctomycetota bacterium]|nr:hypothetical protein [Planctomycetota bacterium]